MPKSETRTIVDAFVYNASPTQNWSTVDRSHFGDTNKYYAYLFWSHSAPAKAKVTATLRLRAVAAIGAGGQITIDLLAASWSASRLTWNNKPAVVGGSTITWTAPAAVAAGDYIYIDLSSMMQTVSNGAKFWGIRLGSASGTRRTVYSAESSLASRPVLTLEWTEAPLPPSNLVPRSGAAVSVARPLLNWDFQDFIGNTEQGWFRVQVSSNAGFTSILHDTNKTLGSISEFDLAKTSINLTAATTYYWRVMVWDKTDNPSLWSPVETFQYRGHNTITITNPADTFVEDLSPIISWTSSGTQTGYEVLVYDLGVSPAKLLWRSGRVASTEQSMVIPAGVMTKYGNSYRVWVYVYDQHTRTAVPGGPVVATKSKDFVVNTTATVTPPTGLTIEEVAGTPYVRLLWNRTTLPDTFTLVYNGVTIMTNMDPLDFQIGPDLYRTFHIPRGRENATYSVRAVVNGRTSNAATATRLIRRATSWIYDKDFSNGAQLLNCELEVEDREIASVVEPLEGKPFLVVQDGVDGFTGSVSADLAAGAGSGLTGIQMRDRIQNIWKNKGGLATIVHSTKMLSVYIYAVKFKELPQPDGNVDFRVTFNFVEA